jgi:hypothetical protein
MPKEVPMIAQERTYTSQMERTDTSQVWYTPEATALAAVASAAT